ncbi:MAG: hypothetical protein ACREF4_23175, partial [Gammaproteobacteria bacterium]
SLFSAALLAGDVSGSYSGTVSLPTPGGERQRPLSMILKQAPEKLIVSIGPNVSEQHAASNVKLDGDKLTFEVIPPGAGSGDGLKFDLRIDNDKLTGTQVVTRSGESRTGKVHLKKQ